MLIWANQRHPYQTMDRGSLILKTSLCIALFGDNPWIKSISLQIFISKSNYQFELIRKLWMLCFKSFHLSDIYLEHFYPRFRHYCAKYFSYKPKIGFFIGFNVKLYGVQSRPRSMGQGRPVCQKWGFLRYATRIDYGSKGFQSKVVTFSKMINITAAL